MKPMIDIRQLFFKCTRFLPQRLLDPRTWMDASTGPAKDDANQKRSTVGEGG